MVALTQWFIGDYRPAQDATRDLGTALFRWRDLFVSRNATIGGTLSIATLTLTSVTNMVFNNDELVAHNDDVVFT